MATVASVSITLGSLMAISQPMPESKSRLRIGIAVSSVIVMPMLPTIAMSSVIAMPMLPTTAMSSVIVMPMLPTTAMPSVMAGSLEFILEKK
ncbi:hypothetical protein ACFPRA_07755 [Sporosarcina soli]|uniref:Uncharacterized protein n=1 Tax=Sporosarcina soli TaxID=334736 RepID=A0ABW0TH58_9BACL